MKRLGRRRMRMLVRLSAATRLAGSRFNRIPEDEGFEEPLPPRQEVPDTDLYILDLLGSGFGRRRFTEAT